MNQTIDFSSIIPKFDAILERGLCAGIGTPDGQVCIEAAICMAMGLPFGDDPTCVDPAVRVFKIALNDAAWSSPRARAKGLRDLGIAQIGSRDSVDGAEFSRRLAEGTIRILIPHLFISILAEYPDCLMAAERCAMEGTAAAALAAAEAAACATAAWAWEAARAAGAAAAAAEAVAAETTWAADGAAAGAATWAARAAGAAGAARAARAGAWEAAQAARDLYLNMSATIALGVLRELKSPGCEWLEWKGER
jgi:hypothetical protein